MYLYITGVGMMHGMDMVVPLSTREVPLYLKALFLNLKGQLKM